MIESSTKSVKESLPTLIRTSTLPSEFIRQHLDIVNTPIHIDVSPEVSKMQQNWLIEEDEEERRLVRLIVDREGHATFKILAEALSPRSYSSSDSSLVISCIKWREKNTFVVTSVDVILVLEYLVGEHFPIEEKSRIRRNLQFLKPYTVTKSSKESSRLFSTLMSMENPRPRNIEKGLKVFEWTDLFVAVNRVLSKYSATPMFSNRGISIPSKEANKAEGNTSHKSSTFTDSNGNWYPRPDKNASFRNAPIYPQSSISSVPPFAPTVFPNLAGKDGKKCSYDSRGSYGSKPFKITSTGCSAKPLYSPAILANRIWVAQA